MTKRMFEHREETHKSRMPLDRPSDFPAAALRAHLSKSLVPSHFSPIPDSPEVVNYHCKLLGLEATFIRLEAIPIRY